MAKQRTAEEIANAIEYLASPTAVKGDANIDAALFLEALHDPTNKANIPTIEEGLVRLKDAFGADDDTMAGAIQHLVS